MRMRKKKNTDSRLLNCSDYLLEEGPIESDCETVLEIGCGKGSFVCQMAKREPDTFFVAMEKVPDVAMLACENAKREGLTNVRFIIADAKELGKYFINTKVSRIYLNFSDPWTRSGYHKRRLTYRSFLEIYKSIMTKDGTIYFKTDNRELFESSVDEMRFSGFDVRNITYDLHNSEFAEDNIITEYEKNFSSKGFPIHRLEAHLTDDAFFRLDKANNSQIDEITALFDSGREYMRKNSIPQWQDGYPSKELLLSDIEKGDGYALIFKKKVVGYCTLVFGDDPTYSVIENGDWKNSEPYGAMHRIVISEEFKGLGLAGRLVSDFGKIALENGINNLRADTHEVNRSMRRMLEKNGFDYCGVIHLENGDPRVAYQKIL